MRVAPATSVLLVAGACLALPVLTTAVPSAASSGQAVVTDVATAAELRDAVRAANERPGGDVIRLAASITLAGPRGSDADGPEVGDLDVTESLNVEGNGHALDAAGVDRHFDVSRSSALVLERIVLTGGSTAGSGGAVRSAGTLVLDSSLVQDNRAGASGGGVLNDGGTLTVRASRLLDNTATASGGAIASRGGGTVVLSSRLQGNASGSGGGLHLSGPGAARVVGSNVIANTATTGGGGLWCSRAGQLLVQGGVVARNRASGSGAGRGGGGIDNHGCSVRVDRAAVTQNAATGSDAAGGGAHSDGGTLVITRSQISLNAASGGGGLSVARASAFISETEVRSNAARTGDGGGVQVSERGSLRVAQSQVRDNTAARSGGGVAVASDGQVLVQRSRLSTNRAAGGGTEDGGGGLVNDDGRVRIESSSVLTNSAGTDYRVDASSGGGLLLVRGSLVLLDSSLADNSAARAGGGVSARSGALLLRRTEVRLNRVGPTTGRGGGVHVTGTSTSSWIGGSLADNRAATQGGGLWCGGGGDEVGSGITLSGVALSGNAAPEGPAAYRAPGPGSCSIDGVPLVAGLGT